MFVFVAFGNINIKAKFQVLPKISLFIYLMHAIIVEGFLVLLSKLDLWTRCVNIEPIVFVPLATVLIMCISIVCSQIYVIIRNMAIVDRTRERMLDFIFGK